MFHESLHSSFCTYETYVLAQENRFQPLSNFSSKVEHNVCDFTLLQHSGLLYCSNFVTVSVSTPWLSFKWQSWSKMRLNFYSSSNVKMPFFCEDGFIYRLTVLYNLLFNYRVVKCNRLFNFYLFLCQTFATLPLWPTFLIQIVAAFCFAQIVVNSAAHACGWS